MCHCGKFVLSLLANYADHRKKDTRISVLDGEPVLAGKNVITSLSLFPTTSHVLDGTSVFELCSTETGYYLLTSETLAENVLPVAENSRWHRCP